MIGGVNLISRYCYLVLSSSIKGKDHLGTLSQGPRGLKKNQIDDTGKAEIDIEHAFLVIFSASLLSEE